MSNRITARRTAGRRLRTRTILVFTRNSLPFRADSLSSYEKEGGGMLKDGLSREKA